MLCPYHIAFAGRMDILIGARFVRLQGVIVIICDDPANCAVRRSRAMIAVNDRG